jgi:receptor protein-tyrosine kinase
MTRVMQKIHRAGLPSQKSADDDLGLRTPAVAEPTAPVGSDFVADSQSEAAAAAGTGPTVPWQRSQVDPAIVLFHRRHGAICEQFRGLRARLLSMNPLRAPQVIAITSAVAQEGKSVSAINLALALAEGGEYRILLVDADLRRAALARMLGLPRNPGLADVLSGGRRAADVWQASPLANLTVLTSGTVPNNAFGELLGSGGTAGVLAEFRALFDYVLIDLPPVTTVSDACLLGPLCDGVVVVVQMGGTAEPTVQRAVRTLQANNVKVLGAILSRFREYGRGYYDYDDNYPRSD